jgi:hypothetical protein
VNDRRCASARGALFETLSIDQAQTGARQLR